MSVSRDSTDAGERHNSDVDTNHAAHNVPRSHHDSEDEFEDAESYEPATPAPPPPPPPVLPWRLPQVPRGGDPRGELLSMTDDSGILSDPFSDEEIYSNCYMAPRTITPSTQTVYATALLNIEERERVLSLRSHRPRATSAPAPRTASAHRQHNQHTDVNSQRAPTELTFDSSIRAYY